MGIGARLRRKHLWIKEYSPRRRVGKGRDGGEPRVTPPLGSSPIWDEEVFVDHIFNWRIPTTSDGKPFRIKGFLGWWVTRTYHLYQLPLFSRKLRVVTDWTVALLFRRDVVELGTLEHPRGLGD